MAIVVGDIKLAKSFVMDDVPEGGGPPVAAIVVDAVSNEIFNDISELDRAGGRVNLRKTFIKIDTNNRDGYFGGNVIVAKPPADPRVSVTVFSPKQVFDTRAEAVARVEAYLNAGPVWPGFLYENHITGQRSIQIMQREGQPLPAVGRTLLIRQSEGLPQQKEQYVRTTRVDSETRTYTDDQGDYKGVVVTCDLSDALRYDFIGTGANRVFNKGSTAALMRDTVVADAATYYGCVPLADPVVIGDVVVQAESVYTQLVPNSVTETAIIDQIPSSNPVLVLATVPITVETVETPFSQRIRIGQSNRGYNFVSILKPLPAPGSVRVTYRALGNNYTIIDNGDGTMGGSGTGTINYLTGSITFTLQALPDDRSGVMIYWAQTTRYVNRSGQAGFRPPEYNFQLDNRNVLPGTFTMSWTSNLVVKTATDNGSGLITGDATGKIAYASGQISFRPGTGAFPDASGEFDIDYDWEDLEVESFPGLAPDGSGVVMMTLSQEPAPRSIRCTWITTRTVSESSGSSLGGSSSSKSNGSSTVSTETKTILPRTFNAFTGGIMYSGGQVGAGGGWA
jgi:hypothetical protein